MAAISALVFVAGALFVWHKVDKGSAVRKAVNQYVARVELKTAQAQIDEANRRREVAETANARLQERVQVAIGEAARVAQEIERYEAENDIPISCRVEPNLFERLRGK